MNVDLPRDARVLIRDWRSDAADQERLAKRLTGAERSAALAHGNTKSACANALERLLWGAEAMPSTTTTAKGAKR